MNGREIGLGVWNVYFIFKLILFINGKIEFSFLNNLAFIAFLFLPVRHKFLVVLKQIIAIPLGAYLFYDDSYLPPISRAFAQSEQLSHFELGYLFELATRFVSLHSLLILFIVGVFYFLFHQIFRVSVFVTGAVLYLQLSNVSLVSKLNQNTAIAAATGDANPINETTSANLTEQLSGYQTDLFTQQAELKLPLNKSAIVKTEFDILVLSVCSLAWDDVKFFHQENHKLFKEFDVLFEHFNAATSYSGPAVIRLLQANCGQKPHTAIMTNPSDDDCYLLENLKSLGFDIELILNHNGAFDNFLSLIKDKGKIEATPIQYKLPPYLRSFDDSDISRDSDVFSQWSSYRDSHQGRKKFTFYNTISLHDGVHYEEDHSLKSAATYEKRLITLLDDMYDILDGLKRANRPIVVLFVPEHGGNVRGDKMQIAGMRELPSPVVTNVPVGLKIIGNNIQRSGEQRHVTQQSSFLAIAHIVNQLLEQDIFSQTQFDPEKILNNLPETPMISENDGSIVMQYHQNYYYSFNNNEWVKYDE